MPASVKLAVAAIGVLSALLLGMMFAVTGGDSDAASSAKQTGPSACVAGSGLRAGTVPNGWEADILAAAQASGVPGPILAAQLEVESGWNPNAASTKGARGLAQFLPGTWQAYGQGSPTDPKAAIAAQGKYMAALLQAVSSVAAATGADKVTLALAAYNAGPGRITEYRGVPPFAETQAYVAKIPALAQQTYAGDCTQQTGGQVVVQVGPGQWASPLPGGILTSTFSMRWGVMHWGIDLAVAGGQVTAPTDLVITWAGDHGDGYGTSVVGRTTDGTDLQMRFGHCAAGSTTVTTGSTAAAGSKLCDMGSTGDSTGPHLHFEIYQPGSPQNAYATACGCAVDPLPILAGKGMNF